MMSPNKLLELLREQKGKLSSRWALHIIVYALSSENTNDIFNCMSDTSLGRLCECFKIAQKQPALAGLHSLGSQSRGVQQVSDDLAPKLQAAESNRALNMFLKDCWDDVVAELRKWFDALNNFRRTAAWTPTKELWSMLGCNNSSAAKNMMYRVRTSFPEKKDEINSWFRRRQAFMEFNMAHYEELAELCVSKKPVVSYDKAGYIDAEYIGLEQLIAELGYSPSVFYATRKKLSAENAAKFDNWIVNVHAPNGKGRCKLYPVACLAEAKEMFAELPHKKGVKRNSAATPKQPQSKSEPLKKPNLVMPQQPKNQLEVRVLQAYLDEMQELFGYIHQYSQQTEADKADYIKQLGSATAAETVGLLSGLTVANNTLLELQRLESDAQKCAAEILHKAENEFLALVADLRQIKK